MPSAPPASPAIGAKPSALSPPAPISPASSGATGRLTSRVPQRPPDLLDRDDAAEAAFGVDRHQGAEAAEVLVGEEGVEGSVVADEEADVLVDQVGHMGAGPGTLGHLVGPVALDQAEKAVGGVDDREPGPAVAEEVL